MTSVPNNPHVQDTSEDAVKPIVLLGDDEGNAPTPEDRCTWLRNPVIVQTAGGAELDSITFDVDLDELEQRLQDLETPTEWKRQVEVRLANDDGEALGELIAWGELTIQEIRLGDGEAAVVVARVEPYHFGSVCLGQMVYDPVAPGVLQTHLDPVFNPEIDDKIEGNQSDEVHPDDEFLLWIDPESIRTEQSLELQDQTGSLWTLGAAADTMQFMLNADETFIRLDQTVDATEDWDDAPDIKNLQLRRGQDLPAYFDVMLQPNGFNWFLDYSLGAANTDDADDDPPPEPSANVAIQTYRVGVGQEVELHYQAIGETLDLAKQDVADLTVSWNVADLANVIIGHGSLIERQITVELFPAWQEADDDIAYDNLSKSKKGVDGLFEAYPDVHRKWVASEAGDYAGTRETAGYPSGHLDLDSVFGAGNWRPIRRPMGDCLSLDSKGNRREPWVEYRNPDFGAGAGIKSTLEWLPMGEKWSCRLLDDQIGVYFDGEHPPRELYDHRDQARIRITGTIRGDQRLSGTATRQDTSPNARDVTLFLDLSDRFHDRKIQKTGDLASALSHPDDDTRAKADEADDQAALTAYLEKLRDVNDSANMSASIKLHGIFVGYRISDLITKVDGRNISLDRNNPNQATRKYLQITGRTLDFAAQMTTLIVEAVEPPG